MKDGRGDSTVNEFYTAALQEVNNITDVEITLKYVNVDLNIDGLEDKIIIIRSPIHSGSHGDRFEILLNINGTFNKAFTGVFQLYSQEWDAVGSVTVLNEVNNGWKNIKVETDGKTITLRYGGNFNKSTSLIENQDKDVYSETDYSEEVYGVIDYPLLDIPIRYNDSNIVMIVVNNVMQSDKSEYFFTDDKQILESMQLTFNVISFPVGRGTTPDSMVYIYRDNILIREIPFLGKYINAEKFDMESLSKLDIETRIMQELPPPI